MQPPAALPDAPPQLQASLPLHQQLQPALLSPDAASPESLLEALLALVEAGTTAAPAANGGGGRLPQRKPLHVVAFSGGVDSSLVAYLLRNVHGSDAVACIGVSASLPAHQLEAARAVAAHIGIALWEVPTSEGEVPGYVANEGQVRSCIRSSTLHACTHRRHKQVAYMFSTHFRLLVSLRAAWCAVKHLNDENMQHHKHPSSSLPAGLPALQDDALLDVAGRGFRCRRTRNLARLDRTLKPSSSN